MRSEDDAVSQPQCQIWFSERVSQFRWVLNFGIAEDEVFTGNARSFEQAMKDIEICRGIFEESRGIH